MATARPWWTATGALPIRRCSIAYAHFGAALQQDGIAPGDRVAVLARNGVLPLEAHFAVPLIGAVLVPLNIRSAKR